MTDVVALGELLIDFTPARSADGVGHKCFEQNPGGAPANVLAVLSKYGAKCAFMGKVGADIFGDFLREQLLNYSIDCRNLISDWKYNTTLAFVSLDDEGNRSFSFYRNHGADTRFLPEEINLDLIRECRIFHFGTLSMTHEPALSATRKAVEYAKASGKILSFDPNYRPLLWDDEGKAIKAMVYGLKYADIAKLSLQEAQMVTGKTDPEDCLKVLLGYGLRFVAITMGPDGCVYAAGEHMGKHQAVSADVVDTTGAGDIFWGTFLYVFLMNGAKFEELPEEILSDFVLTAGIAAAMSTEKKGAIPSIPDFSRVKEAFERMKI